MIDTDFYKIMLPEPPFLVDQVIKKSFDIFSVKNDKVYFQGSLKLKIEDLKQDCEIIMWVEIQKDRFKKLIKELKGKKLTYKVKESHGLNLEPILDLSSLTAKFMLNEYTRLPILELASFKVKGNLISNEDYLDLQNMIKNHFEKY